MIVSSYSTARRSAMRGLSTWLRLSPVPESQSRVGEHLLAPHLVFVVDAAAGAHRQAGPADAVEVVARIGAHHRLGQRRHAFGRVGPRPRGGEHADRAHLADLVVEHLVHVAVHVGDVGEGLEHLVHLAPVAHPEVPRRVVLVQRRVREDDRPAGPCGQLDERAAQPLQLLRRRPPTRRRPACRRASPCGPCAPWGSSCARSRSRARG